MKVFCNLGKGNINEFCEKKVNVFNFLFFFIYGLLIVI